MASCIALKSATDNALLATPTKQLLTMLDGILRAMLPMEMSALLAKKLVRLVSAFRLTDWFFTLLAYVAQFARLW